MDVVFDVAKEIRNLQEVISNIKMDYEDELGKLKREVQELSSKKDESQAIVVYLQVDPVRKQPTDIFNFMFVQSQIFAWFMV
ncbi:hypothetical protein Hdeb2414_s0517g00909021 [Helianthus debilis subsp. tardiflorus]